MSFGQPDIQALINAGNGFGAAVIGEACDWRRPQSAINPVPAGASLGPLSVYFNPDFKFKGVTPSLYGKSVFGALFDATSTRVGDYLFGLSGTYFIAVQNGLLTTAAVQCNAVITISRGAGNAGPPGKKPYGGRTAATDVPLMAGWPASVLRGGRQEAGRVDLPADPSMGGYEVLLPVWLGVVIETGDRIVDDQGRAMVVNLAERSSLGWRLGTTMAVP